MTLDPKYQNDIPPKRTQVRFNLVGVQLETNIAGVLERARRRGRDLNLAIDQTLDVAAWREPMRREAQRTLWALAAQEEWAMVDPFMETMFTAVMPDGFFSQMSNPLPPVPGLADFQSALQTQGAGGPGLFSGLLNRFDELMTEWVATEKRKDRRDWSKTDEEIGRWIGYLMLTADSALTPLERDTKGKFMPYIVEFLQRRQTAGRMPDATINRWLLAVLAAWQALVKREFPERLRARLEAIRMELN